MKSQTAAAFLLTVAAATAAATAQGDTIALVDGTVVEDAKIQSFDIRELKYVKSGNQSVPADKVARIEVAKFKDTYRRGLADKSPDLIVTTTREQVQAKNALLAQLGYVEAARMFFQQGEDGKGAAALDELKKNVPDAGLLPEFYRMKFEEYMSRGDAGGFQNAGIVAKQLQNDAVTNAWPPGFAIEGEFYLALVERAQGGDPAAFQKKLRDVVGKALGSYPNLVNRANVQLAHSLRESKDVEGARKLYREVLDRDGVDDSSRAGAWLGLGLLKMQEGDAANREPFRDALLNFLRVRLETKNAWASLQAEALYNAMLAAEKWGGEEWGLIAGRCRYYLTNEYPESEWAKRAKGR